MAAPLAALAGMASGTGTWQHILDIQATAPSFLVDHHEA